MRRFSCSLTQCERHAKCYCCCRASIRPRLRSCSISTFAALTLQLNDVAQRRSKAFTSYVLHQVKANCTLTHLAQSGPLKRLLNQATFALSRLLRPQLLQPYYNSNAAWSPTRRQDNAVFPGFYATSVEDVVLVCARLVCTCIVCWMRRTYTTLRICVCPCILRNLQNLHVEF